MSGNQRSFLASSWARSALVSLVSLAILTVVIWLNLGTPADAADLSPEGAAVFKTKDQLLITITLSSPDGAALKGKLAVELIGPDGKGLAKAEQAVRQKEAATSYRFELPSSELSPDKLKLRCRFGTKQFEVALNKVILAKAHETSLTASSEFFSGSTAAVRCSVHGVKSIAESVPLTGAEVDIQLSAADGKVYPLFKDKTGTDGVSRAQLKIPRVSPGKYTLQVATRSNLGEEKLQREVRIKADPKIMLVTDKPLYQPGQVIHIRALALQTFDLTPVDGRDMVFEVEDSKGNKVFKRNQQTSAYGIAAIDFQLADEVNMGDYRVRAILGEHQADKTVTVKKYVLPKFKTIVSADKRFYLPKETIHAEVQTDYFFGKPVAEGKIQVSASTFDVQFKEFMKWEGRTDKNGHAKFEVKLPDYFVGQPLEKGNALVKLEVKITDSADHTETITKTYPVSSQAIRISLIPEGGRLVPDLENRIFATAITPDGSPVACDVNLWLGKEAKGKPAIAVKTNDAGLAEFKFRPKPEQFRPSNQWEQRNVEMLGRGQVQAGWGQKIILDLFAEAKDAKGNAAHALTEMSADPLGDNVIIRLDKAIYKTGDTMKVELNSSAGLPTAYIDFVRGGQILLSRWLDVKDGKANAKLDLPPEVLGTLEIHAYQMLASGEIIRDSRVVYVQPREDLKITVKPSQDVYLPGKEGTIRFQVTDAGGNPTQAALGVIIVDEAVFALQEMQPGLERVYFTLQEELLKPQAQAVFQPREGIDVMVQQPELPADKQQIAQVLLNGVKPKPPVRWEVAPELERKQKVQGQVQQIGWAMMQYAGQHSFLAYDKEAKRWNFKPGLLDNLVNVKQIDAVSLNDPFGTKWTFESLAKLEKDFTADRLAQAITVNHMQNLQWVFIQHSNNNRAKWLKNGKWTFPDNVLEAAIKAVNQDKRWLLDAWGKPIKVVKRDKKWEHQTGQSQFDFHEFVSAGPDGVFDTDDDVKQSNPKYWNQNVWMWWNDFGIVVEAKLGNFGRRGGMMRNEMLMMKDAAAAPGGFGIGGGGRGPMAPQAAYGLALGEPKSEAKDPGQAPGTGGTGTAPVRVREYFPETMLWQPSLITDEKGIALLPVQFADSITTWRLSASASSRGGTLGSTSAPLRVFQDFFVDIDLPVSLTQNDEVAFPVVVYNYLKEAQTVKLELQQEGWFELADGAGLTRSLDLKPNEVTAVKFRIRARKIGYNPLTVKATGSKLSDAIKRSIEVVPDGQKVEQVVTDKLAGRVTHTITIPDNAIPDSYKLMVKLYPGVISQVLEGTEGLLRLPGG